MQLIIEFVYAENLLANSVKTEDIVRALETKPIEHFYGISIASGEKTYGTKRMLN